MHCILKVIIKDEKMMFKDFKLPATEGAIVLVAGLDLNKSDK